MEQTATAGTIQVSGDTDRLIAPLFDFEALGGIEVRGKAAPVNPFRVIGAKAAPCRLAVSRGLDPPKTAGCCFRANYPERVNRCGLAAHFDSPKGLEVKERRDEPVGFSRNLNCARRGSLLHPSGQVPISKATQAEYSAPASPKQTR